MRGTSVGRGVFMMRNVRRGALVGNMLGAVINHDEYDPHYVVDLGQHGVLDPRPPFRFLNHSCVPNARLVEVTTEGTPGVEIVVEALRTIRRGEQVTIDYAWPAGPEPMRCGCGSDECRGWVVDLAELPRLKRLLRHKPAAE